MNNIAVLFIHGFMGHPNEYKILGEFFTNLGYDIHSFVLSGHQGGKIKNVIWEDWEKNCIDNVESLKNKGYEKIILVGHSMGGVLASMMAIKYEDYVSKLILIDPALEYLRMKNGKLRIIPSLKQAFKVLNDKNNKEHSSQVWRCSISSIKEFYSLVKKHGNDIEKVKCPVLFLHGNNDYVIPIEQIKNIYDRLDNENKKFITIENGSHWILSSKLDDEIYKIIDDFLLDNVNINKVK